MLYQVSFLILCCDFTIGFFVVKISFNFPSGKKAKNNSLATCLSVPAYEHQAPKSGLSQPSPPSTSSAASSKLRCTKTTSEKESCSKNVFKLNVLLPSSSSNNLQLGAVDHLPIVCRTLTRRSVWNREKLSVSSSLDIFARCRVFQVLQNQPASTGCRGKRPWVTLELQREIERERAF